MSYLLDTHAFIWLDSESENLPAVVRDLVTDSDEIIYFSIASLWEIQIKNQLGKLDLRKPLGSEKIKPQRHRGHGVYLYPPCPLCLCG
jgi:PIN domain nuclease of toxin-antitoxin system